MLKFWLIPDNPPTHPDCFLILSYAVKNRDLPTRPTRAEIELAYQWWKNFPNAPLIMSTGDNQQLGVTNAAVMAKYAIQLGIPAQNIIQENRSVTTYQNLLYCTEIINTLQCKQPTLITLDLYTRRAVATAQKLGWKNFHWLSVYAKGEPAYGTKSLQTYSRLTIWLYEQIALLYSKLVGWA